MQTQGRLRILITAACVASVACAQLPSIASGQELTTPQNVPLVSEPPSLTHFK